MNRNFSFPYVEILRIYLCALLRSEIYNTLRKQSRREVVSYRFTDLLSYCRAVVLHRRLTAAGQYVLLSLALQIFNAFCQRISNEL